MKIRKLSSQAFGAARAFIEEKARPLEVALFRYEFGGGYATTVCDTLKQYQNEDGGFGHALEPDLRTAESSVLCTSVALQIIRSISIETDESIARRAVTFLLKNLDRQNGHWRIIPEKAEESPHAPWWNQEGREASYDQFSLNPTAEILGYLYEYQKYVDIELIAFVQDKVIAHLSVLDQIEMHDLLCCLRLIDTRSLPESIRANVVQLLRPLVLGSVALKPEQWLGYSLRPLQVVGSPDAVFYEDMKEAVSMNLDYEITSQNKDGEWAPSWSWGDSYPESWPRAEREWAGILTVSKLLTLKNFNRIET